MISYSEQRQQLIDNMKAYPVNIGYVVMGDNEYVTIKDFLSDREFIISRFEIEEV